MNRFNFLLLLVSMSAAALAQEKVGDKWVDNKLSFKVIDQSVKTNGELYVCVADTVTNNCIENLKTGFKVKVYDAEGSLIWEGIGSGRAKGLKISKALPTASYITITAFKPYVTNKTTGNYIHQDKPISIKYNL